MTPLPPSSHGKPIDTFGQAAELDQELGRAIRGEVRFDRGSRALYATDASNYRQVPIGVVVPRDEDDVRAAVSVCRRFGAPILARGSGTSLAGQSCNVAVVLDFTKYMNRILEIDFEKRIARVQPGVILDTLRGRAEQKKLTFGPDPSTHSRCSLGGMIGNNSCGTHSLISGKTVDNVHELRILLYDGTELTVGATPEAELEAIVREGGRRGEIYAGLRSIRDRYLAHIRTGFPQIPRRVSGYNLDQLLPEQGFHVARALVGTEGTCAIVLGATLRLIESPQHRVLVGLGYPDSFAAADHVPAILETSPIGLEGFEGGIIDGLNYKGAPNLDLLPPGRGILLAEYGSNDPAESRATAERLVLKLSGLPGAPVTRIYSAAESKAVWKIRESGPRMASAVPGSLPRWEGWDDASVAPERLGPYLRELRSLLDEYGYQAAFYGHFGHGCIHMQVSFDFETEEGIRKYEAFINRAADLVVRYGGSLSGEHGDGQSRGALLPKMFGPELMQAFAEFKAVWDPGNRMNPHKVIDAYQPTENLRLGADYNPAKPATFFTFPDDKGSFAKAAMRCIGLGECRKHDYGTMCPSYMATLEERHSTRGRARLLWELLQGEVLTDSWKNEQTKEALDLCLSCKACKSECPTNVDMATYRSEFLAHYYETRSRPLAAYAFGLVDRWASLGSVAPVLANLTLNVPGVAPLIKRLLHLAPQRALPKLAPQSFTRWARSTSVPTPGSGNGGKPGVILWADTFNNYFHPETSQAALAVLKSAGFHVMVPSTRLCCGRPLYDFGMLDRARAYLSNVLDQLAPHIAAGVPMVVLEPSCASVFRDELRSLFPSDERAGKLRAQTFLLSEFLERHAPGFAPPKLERSVLVHGHCHHKALMKMTDEESLLKKMGATVTMPDAGCCGMAGPFGFEAKKFDVSMAIGERVLLPAVRHASTDTLIVADGFSCREQIEQATGRKPIHLAEVIQLALNTSST
ncbi:MAG TPA: FAD-binding and (Fe-S)-binding domain-containing protein [Vicinamibacterales bacterium]|nr:FAD-binding and (Fe-S)-binding domain-containing protein [Vicinamibacterales bacterium]